MSWIKSVRKKRIKKETDSGHILKSELIELTERIKCVKICCYFFSISMHCLLFISIF